MRKKLTNLNHNLSYIVKDGVYYSIMVGIGESYLIPFAIFFGATSAQVGYLVSMPQLMGAFFQLFSVHLLTFLRNRKQLMLLGVGLQAVAWVPLLWLPFSFINYTLLCLVLGYSLYFVFGNLASPPWNSLVGDLVPEDQRGNYFGLRTKIMSLFTFGGLCLGGLILYFTQRFGHPFAGFMTIFSIAGLCRWIGFSCLKKIDEPPMMIHEEKLYLRDFFLQLKRSNFSHYAFFSALILFSVHLAAPFFAVYMFKDLHFTYIQYMLIVGTAVMAQYLTFLYWGDFADRFGNWMVLKITGGGLPLLPLLWLFSIHFYYILFIQVISGFVWSGFSLSLANFIFDTVPSHERARCVAIYSILNAIGVFLGALLGSTFIPLIPSVLKTFHWTISLPSNLMFLFFISGILRLVVYLFFLPKIQEVREVEAFSLKHAIYKNLRSSTFYK